MNKLLVAQYQLRVVSKLVCRIVERVERFEKHCTAHNTLNQWFLILPAAGLPILTYIEGQYLALLRREGWKKTHWDSSWNRQIFTASRVEYHSFNQKVIFINILKQNMKRNAFIVSILNSSRYELFVYNSPRNCVDHSAYQTRVSIFLRNLITLSRIDSYVVNGYYIQNFKENKLSCQGPLGWTNSDFPLPQQSRLWSHCYD